MKPKKRKEKLDFILEEVSSGITVYRNDHDSVGVCGFCQELSYKPHHESCPVKLAQELLGREP